ncbi:MAG TPA: hypothetical protein VG778_07590, partial [Blastocatellia bacterium]|nr:hypothetical protein [Blastocatellia bacterium]
IALPSLAMTFGIFALLFADAASRGPYGSSSGAPEFFFPLLIFGSLLMVLVVLPAAVYLQGGMFNAAFKQLRGGKLEFRDLFSAGDRFLPLLGATILTQIIVMIGAMLCIIPGLIAAGLLMFVPPLIVERRLGVIDAIRESYELTKRKMLLFTLFALLLQLIVSAGSYVCYVGILATYPLFFTITAVAFRDCFGVPGAHTFIPPTPAQLAPYASTPQYSPPPDQQPPSAIPPSPQPPLQPRQGSICSSCKTQLPATATFCFRCGTRVES